MREYLHGFHYTSFRAGQPRGHLGYHWTVFEVCHFSSPLPHYVMSSWHHNCSLSLSWSCGESWWASWATRMVDLLVPSGSSYLPSWGWAWIYPEATTLRLMHRMNDSIVCSRSICSTLLNARQKNWVQLLNVTQFFLTLKPIRQLGRVPLKLQVEDNFYCLILLIIFV